MTQSSIIDAKNLPKEYLSLFKKIPQNEMDLFFKSLDTVSLENKISHTYLHIIKAIKNTIKVC